MAATFALAPALPLQSWPIPPPASHSRQPARSKRTAATHPRALRVVDRSGNVAVAGGRDPLPHGSQLQPPPQTAMHTVVVTALVRQVRQRGTCGGGHPTENSLGREASWRQMMGRHGSGEETEDCFLPELVLWGLWTGVLSSNMTALYAASNFTRAPCRAGRL